MSTDFYEGVFAALACVLTGALIVFVVMALRNPPDVGGNEGPDEGPRLPEPYHFDTVLPHCPDDARELEEIA